MQSLKAYLHPTPPFSKLCLWVIDMVQILKLATIKVTLEMRMLLHKNIVKRCLVVTSNIILTGYNGDRKGRTLFYVLLWLYQWMELKWIRSLDINVNSGLVMELFWYCNFGTVDDPVCYLCSWAISWLMSSNSLMPVNSPEPTELELSCKKQQKRTK